MDSRELQTALYRWRRRKNRLLLISGQKKAGKTTLLKYLKRHYGDFLHIRFADAPMKIAKILEIPPDRRVFHALFGVNALLRPILGESAYKRRVARILDRTNPPLALIEAIRTDEEFQEFFVKRGGIQLGVAADLKVRFKRILADALGEKKDEAEFTYEQFVGDPEKQTGEYHPIEREIAGIVARSHFILDNNSDNPRDLYRQIDEVMKQLGIPKRRRQHKRK